MGVFLIWETYEVDCCDKTGYGGTGPGQDGTVLFWHAVSPVWPGDPAALTAPAGLLAAGAAGAAGGWSGAAGGRAGRRQYQFGYDAAFEIPAGGAEGAAEAGEAGKKGECPRCGEALGADRLAGGAGADTADQHPGQRNRSEPHHPGDAAVRAPQRPGAGQQRDGVAGGGRLAAPVAAAAPRFSGSGSKGVSGRERRQYFIA